MILSWLILIPIAFVAGIMAAIAGGGVFLTFPALMLTGLDPRAANITSTVAMYPMQVSTGFSGRNGVGGTGHLSFKALLLISLIGGIVGAVLLLATPPAFFARLVPWLILFATVVFAWGSFRKKNTPPETPAAAARKPDHLGSLGAALTQLAISIYGGYFGGGIGLMMLAMFTLAGMNIKKATMTKNILAAIMNTSAVAIFLFSKDIHWARAGIVAIASIAGGLIGVRIIEKVNERWLRIAVVAIGTILSAAMFLKAP